MPAPCKPLPQPQQTPPGPPSPTHKLRLTSMPPGPLQAPQPGQEASQTSRGFGRLPCWAIFPRAVRLPGLPAGVSSPKPRRPEERVAHVRPPLSTTSSHCPSGQVPGAGAACHPTSNWERTLVSALTKIKITLILSLTARKVTTWRSVRGEGREMGKGRGRGGGGGNAQTPAVLTL